MEQNNKTCVLYGDTTKKCQVVREYNYYCTKNTRNNFGPPPFDCTRKSHSDRFPAKPPRDYYLVYIGKLSIRKDNPSRQDEPGEHII